MVYQKKKHSSIFFSEDELIKELGITHDKFSKWLSMFDIKPIQNFSGEKIYPKSWLETLCSVKECENTMSPASFEEICCYLVGWSIDEAEIRLRQVLSYFEVDLDNPDLRSIWNAFVFFLREPIVSYGFEELSLEAIETWSREEYTYWCLLRQTDRCVFRESEEEEDEDEGFWDHEQYEQLTIMLKYKTDDLPKGFYLNENFFSNYNLDEMDKLLKAIESHPYFDSLISSELLECKIENIPQ